MATITPKGHRHPKEGEPREEPKPPKEYTRRDFLHLTRNLLVGGVAAKVLASTPVKADDEKETERVAQAPARPQVRGTERPSVATQPAVSPITQEEFQTNFAYMFDMANQYRTTTDPTSGGTRGVVIEFERWRIEPDSIVAPDVLRGYSAAVTNRVQMGDVPPNTVFAYVSVNIRPDESGKQFYPMNFRVGTFDIMVIPHTEYVEFFYFDSATGRSGASTARFSLVGQQSNDVLWGAEITPEGVALVAVDATAIADGKLKPGYSLAQVFLEPKANGGLDVYVDLFGIAGE
ncbi:MAG: hypothetical protein WC350_00060 [Candidatus Micrarchaeia archaeon]